VDVREIVKTYLEKNGYDGLFKYDYCACGLDELMPCDEPSPHCEPAYKYVCKRDGCDNADWCDCEDGDDCYRTTKPDKPQSDGGE